MSDERLETALTQAITIFGVRPLDEPARTTGLVADLLADPHVPAADSIVALRAVLQQAANSGDPATVTAAQLAERAADACNAPKWVVDSTTSSVLTALGIEQASPPQPVADEHPVAPRRGGGRNTVLMAVLGLLVVGAAMIAILLLSTGTQQADPGVEPTVSTEAPGTSISPDDTNGTIPPDDTTAPAKPDPEPEPVPEPTGFTVTFGSAQEGEFVVDRGWRVTPNQDELVGIVRLGVAGDSPISGLHTELAPSVAGNGTAIEWTPEPATVANRAARFNLSLNPGEVLQIEFRAPISMEETLTEADVFAWFDEWSEQFEALRPLGDSDALLQPVIESVTE